jgi:alpha-ketoglutarate-dependent 2,4-dichlorophenoxyacetate dioxygenase
METTPLHPDFGVSVTGVDLKAALPDEVVEAIHELIDLHSFLVFPDQHLDDAAQMAFTRRLGPAEPEHVSLGNTGRINYLGTIGNIGPDGKKSGNKDRKVFFQTGNNMWHSDSSFREVPSYVSLMSVHEAPPEGGETLFISQRAAYERLPDATKAEIEPLIAIHDYVYSRTKVHPEAVSPAHAASLPPVPQRVVRVNQRTGARNFYLGSHAREIEGWDHDRSRALIDGLLEDAIADEYIYAHKWRPGEFVIWDNRCLLHRGAGYDADKYRRMMRQSRVLGQGNTVRDNV